MKFKYVVNISLACTALILQSVQADTPDDVVHDLAQGCYAIQSVQNGDFLKKYYKGGAVDNGLGYRFESVSAADSSHFFLKPTSFKNYLLTDKDGRYLASHLPAQISAGRYAGEFSEWRVSAQDSDSGQVFKFHSNSLNMGLRHNYADDDGGLYFFDLLNPHNFTSEDTFKLVAQNDCLSFPEVSPSVSGDVNNLKGNINEPIRGWVDPHTHITSYEFMGGKFMAGKPFHRWGVEEALKDSRDLHGPNGALDLIGNLQGAGDVNFRYNTEGWPNFPYWPNHKSMSHMGYYHKWMERAYLSGLRMVTTALVENEVLCWAQSTVNPASWINPNSCNIMDSLRLQVQRLHEMQDYIDAQSGGPGEGWFRLVTSPTEARAVIADGKMAVLMGVEASETFDCGLRDNCNFSSIDAKLNELYNLGVRTIYPTHKFDNKLGGSRVENGFINLGQFLSSERFFETKECDAETKGAAFTSGFPLLSDVPVIGDILNLIGLNPQYDETIEHCNKHGLTDLGVYLVNRLIDKKMLIELDHLGAESATAVMDIAEARGYSGLITSHSWMNEGANGELHRNTKRLFEAGGFGAPYNSNAKDMEGRVSQYLDVIEQTPYLAGVGIGSDMSGLGNQAGPRDDAGSNPLVYPFSNEFGFTFEKQLSGNRAHDLNTDGIAHYGLFADQIEDMRNINSNRVYEAVMNSAEAYMQMWERAEASPESPYHDPRENFVQIYNRNAQRCMDIPGNDDGLYNGANVQLWSCVDEAHDQQWLWNKETEMFHNRADLSKCLDNRGQDNNNGEIVVWDCVDSDNLRWTYNSNILASKHNPNIVADAYGTGDGDNVGQWEHHGGKQQQWELRPVSSIYKWVDWRDGRDGKCMDVANSVADNGTKVQLNTCNGTAGQKWFFDPVKGTIKAGVTGNYCLDVANGDTSNGSQLIIWMCQEGNVNQQFNRDGDKFSPRLNGNKAIDAAGSNDGDPIQLWHAHGQDHQKWRAGLH